MKKLEKLDIKDLSSKEMVEIHGGGNGAKVAGYIVGKSIALMAGPLGGLLYDYNYFFK